MKFWNPFALTIFSELEGFLFFLFFFSNVKIKIVLLFAVNQLSPLAQRRLWTESVLSLLRFLLDLLGFHYDCSHVFVNLQFLTWSPMCCRYRRTED